MSDDRLLGQIVEGERPGDTIIRLAGRLADPSIDSEEMESWIDWLADLGQRMNECDIAYTNNQCTGQCDGSKRCSLAYGHDGFCDPYGWITDRAPESCDVTRTSNECVEVQYKNGALGWERHWDLRSWRAGEKEVVAWRKLRPGIIWCNVCLRRIEECGCDLGPSF